MQFKSVFITVGTTQFNDLIRVATSREFLALLKTAFGTEKVICQVGTGDDFGFEGNQASRAGRSVFQTDRNVSQSSHASLEVIRLVPSISSYISAADLVISHCGAGSVMECLKAGKKLVVVPNRSLMNDHQTELADALAPYLHKLETHELLEKLSSLDWSSVKRYPKSDMTTLMREIFSPFTFE